MPRPADTGSGRKRKVARRKAGAREVERAAEQIQAFVKRPVKIRKQPKVRPVKKAAAVTIARSGERNSRKLPVAVPKSKRERDAMLIAAGARDTKVRNRTAGEAVRALNERSVKRVALSDPKRAQRIVLKDAMRGVMSDVDRGLRESLAGTPVKGKARKQAIEDLTSGKQSRVKKVGPFTRSQLEREGAVRRYKSGQQLPSPLRKTRYKKPATTPIQKAMERGESRADANALKLLDLAARPFYAGAAAATAAAKGDDVAKAAKRGITGKEKASYRNALRELGVPKAVADVVGTAGDFVLDPANAVSFGSASTARKAGEKAARAAAKKGASEAVIRRARLEAMRAVEDAGKAKVGVRVKVAGKSVDVPVKRVDATKERERLARRKVSGRNVARAVNPRVRPKGVRESDLEMYRENMTDQRAFREAELNRGRRVSRSANKNVKRKETPEIIEGVERQDFAKLDPRRVEIAGRLDAHNKRQLALRKDAGLDAEIGGKVEVEIPKVTANVAAGRERVKKARRAERGAVRALGKVSRQEGRKSYVAGRSAAAVKREQARVDRLKTPELRDELFRAGDELAAAQTALREARAQRAKLERKVRGAEYSAGRQVGRAEVKVRQATHASRAAVERAEKRARRHEQIAANHAHRANTAYDRAARAEGRADWKQAIGVAERAEARAVASLKRAEESKKRAASVRASYDRRPRAALADAERKGAAALEVSVKARGQAAAVRQARLKVRLAERNAARVEARRDELARAMARRGDLDARSVKASREAAYSRKASEGVRRQIEAKRKARVAAEREQRVVVREARAQKKARRVAEQKAARYEGMAEGYMPQFRRRELQEGYKPPVQGGSALTKTVTDHSRKDLRPMADKNKGRTGLERFEDEDLALVLAAQSARDANKIAKARFNKRIVEDAPRYKHGAPLREGEGAYYFDNGDLVRLTDDEIDAGAHKGKQLVRLDDAAYERFVDELKPLDRNEWGEGYDRVQAAWKRLALMTPGFYVRNLIGEATMGYMGTQGARQTLKYAAAGAPGGKAGRTLKRVREREMAELDYFNTRRVVGKTGDKIKVAGKTMNLDDFIDEAQADGVLRKGQQGNELRELQDALGDQSSIVRDSKRRVTKAVPVRGREKAHSFAADIEDRWRLASYMAYRDAGMTRQEARRRALDFHFDYGELSRVERQLRRVLPFYTFNARALEMFARSAVTRPGKLSGVEKARNTVADVTGADPDWMEGSKEYQRRQVPVVARIGGEDLMLQAGLPVGLLNEFPVSLTKAMGKLATGDVAGAAAATANQIEEWSLFTLGLVTPFIKAPTEYAANRSFFFRSDIEAKGRRLVAAPEYLKPLVGTDVGDMLGLVDDYKDKRSGNTTLGYRAKADYLIRQIPGIPAILNRLASKGTNRRDQSQTQEIIAAVTGINPDPVDKVEASFERLYDERDAIDARMGDLRQRGKDDTAEYKRLQAQKRALDAQIGSAKIERGDADSKPKKRKVRKRSGGSGGFTFSGGSSSGGGGSSSGGSSSGFTFGG